MQAKWTPYMTMEEVGRILKISKQAVNFHERNALRKLRKNPLIRKLAEQMDVIPVARGRQ